ncbi:hypothetical isxac3 transposase orfb (fragment) protein [Xanthomonas albilineans GPE PC73]|uniref:Hypothetical isxac3 transposase orfb protein n=1 Tax=Xanthomonas albilineans (strain GPE PC73 / CFBP 7063) TaxID=380358 RepID=D2UCL4_XANAP
MPSWTRAWQYEQARQLPRARSLQRPRGELFRPAQTPADQAASLSRQTSPRRGVDYIEMFYSPKRRHGSTGDLFHVEFKQRYAQRGA